MSCRGTKAAAEAEWRKGQFHLGYLAGRMGQYSAAADADYQRGYRAGVKRHQLESVTPRCRASKTDAQQHLQCTYLAKMEWLDAGYSGEWVPVCKVHGRMAQRAGYSVRERV